MVLLTELFMLNFLMRKLRSNMSFFRLTKTSARVEGNKPNIHDELLYHIHSLLIGEKKRKCNILMTSMLSGNNQVVSSK